jgi:heptosyltransferase I
VIGGAEFKLLEGLPGVEFLCTTSAADCAACSPCGPCARLQVAAFDALLQMQVAARANVLSAFVPATRASAYDAVAVEGPARPVRPGAHRRSAGHPRVDAIGSFCEPLGMRCIGESPGTCRCPTAAHDWARAQWPDDGTPTLGSRPVQPRVRNWRSERYAAVADHCRARGWRVVPVRGRSAAGTHTADAILAAMQAPRRSTWSARTR